MDFWAQHKDFVLKVLAGLGVFLVALIARGITYGDELETETKRNQSLYGKVTRLKVADVGKIGQLEKQKDALATNAATILDQIGWNAADEELISTLIKRTLGYTRSFSGDAAALQAAAARDLDAIRANIDGGFGQLRLKVRDDMVEEASEKNITIAEGLGFQSVLQIEEPELLKYLLQLELATRLVRYCIDAGVLAIDGLDIQTKYREPIPEANPEFLQEYVVRIAFRTHQEGFLQIVNRLEREGDRRVPWRELKVDRLPRPADHLGVELTVVSMAANPDVSFAKPKEQKGP